MSKFLRCAIYTRKSSEEGLDQDFNSLEAQREACEAYVRSQSHEGWRIVPEVFDDGGYSGGNTDRPALRRLMQLVGAGEIDVIVIYKIDRLTRSLTDFARMAETFDKHNVSFVSVTQQFNTTTSMGRLMLNVLLSFAQFEREITGERIRDKIAASKKKGMWMGGNPPMGYDVRDRQLIVNETDAATVQMIFRSYLEVQTVPALLPHLEAAGIRTAKRFSAKGNHYGQRPFTRGHLYKLLTNPIYIGRIPHKTTSHPGQHPRIIDQTLWEAVQNQLAANVQGPRSRRGRAKPQVSLLSGILVSGSGHSFIDSHANKGSRRYRYYIEDRSNESGPQTRLPAPDMERAVTNAVCVFLRDHRSLLGRLTDLERAAIKGVTERASAFSDSLAIANAADLVRALRPLLRRVIYREDLLQIELDGEQLRTALGVTSATSSDPASNSRPGDAEPVLLSAPLTAKRRGRQLKLLLEGAIQHSNVDLSLVTAVSRAHRWAQQLVTGEVASITEIARRESVSPTYVGQLLPLGFLAPSIVESILTGHHPPALTADRLIRHEKIPLRWVDQVGNLAS